MGYGTPTCRASGFCPRNLIITGGFPDIGGKPVAAGSGWKATGGNDLRGMARAKVGITTLQENQWKEIRALVSAGKAASVSGFV